MVFKVLFDRPKDHQDVRELLFAQGASFGARYALAALRRVLTRHDQRLAAFEAVLGGESTR